VPHFWKAESVFSNAFHCGSVGLDWRAFFPAGQRGAQYTFALVNASDRSSESQIMVDIEPT
jgi:hypothetical protein